MNLSKLFEIQAELDKPYQDVPDRLSKDILWMNTELGELANEWNGFKYRRDEIDQEPNVRVKVTVHENGLKFEQYVNPLLDEYTDALSVLLSIGLQTDENILDYAPEQFEKYKFGDVTEYFNLLFGSLYANENREEPIEFYYWVFQVFAELGEMLGFTWEQIETAYMEKAEANKRRNAHA